MSRPPGSLTLGGPGRIAGAQRQAVRSGDAPHHRSRVGREGCRVHGAQRPRHEALLPLLPDDADSLPDADPSRLRREDRRGRYRRCTGPGEWNLPHELAVDAQENLHIIDRENHRLQMFDKNLNYIREIRNDWNPWDANISRRGTESWGWIADHKDERVLKFSLNDGTILAKWGRQGSGPGEFDWVHGIVVDSKGAVYAADTYGQRLQKFVRSSRSSIQ